MDLQELLDQNLAKKDRVEGKCENCGHNYLLHKTEVVFMGKLFIVQIELFENNGSESRKIIDKYCIKGVSTSTYNIQSKKFKVDAAIFHMENRWMKDITLV